MKEILLEQVNVASEMDQKNHFRDNAYDTSLLKFNDKVLYFKMLYEGNYMHL